MYSFNRSNLHSVRSSFPDKYWTPLITRLYYLYDFFLIWMWEKSTELVWRLEMRRICVCGCASHPPGELLNLTMFDINGFNEEETNNDTTFEYQTGSNSYHFLLWMTSPINYCCGCVCVCMREPRTSYKILFLRDFSSTRGCSTWLRASVFSNQCLLFIVVMDLIVTVAGGKVSAPFFA